MTDRPRALAVLIVVFLLGVILGSTGSFYWLRRAQDSRTGGREGARQLLPEHQKLPELLQLNSDQDKRLTEIIAESRKHLEALRSGQTQKIQEIRSETNRKIAAILNEEQKKKFETFLQNLRRRPSHGRGIESPH